MKIAFLDIDGVLVPFQQFCSTEKLIWSTRAMESLNIICSTSTVCVVISSLWRLQEYTNTKAKMLAVLRKNKFKGKLHDHWKTPGQQSLLCNRGNEILEWLSDYGAKTDSWVVLEDYKEARVEFPAVVSERLVQPQSNIGLTNNDADLAIQILDR